MKENNEIKTPITMSTRLKKKTPHKTQANQTDMINNNISDSELPSPKLKKKSPRKNQADQTDMMNNNISDSESLYDELIREKHINKLYSTPVCSHSSETDVYVSYNSNRTKSIESNARYSKTNNGSILLKREQIDRKLNGLLADKKYVEEKNLLLDEILNILETYEKKSTNLNTGNENMENTNNNSSIRLKHIRELTSKNEHIHDATNEVDKEIQHSKKGKTNKISTKDENKTSTKRNDAINIRGLGRNFLHTNDKSTVNTTNPKKRQTYKKRQPKTPESNNKENNGIDPNKRRSERIQTMIPKKRWSIYGTYITAIYQDTPANREFYKDLENPPKRRRAHSLVDLTTSNTKRRKLYSLDTWVDNMFQNTLKN